MARGDVMVRWAQGLALLLALALAASVAAAQPTEAPASCERDDADATIAACSAQISAGQAPASSYQTRAEAYEGKGRYPEAIADRTQALALNPKDSEALGWRAIDYVHLGDRPHAITDYRAYLKLDPDDADGVGVEVAQIASTPAAAAKDPHSLGAALAHDPVAQYASLKAVFAQMVDVRSEGPAPREARRAAGIHDLIDCKEGGSYLGGVGDDASLVPIGDYADLAYQTASWTRRLQAMSYPQAAWGPLIDRFEKAQIARIQHEQDAAPAARPANADDQSSDEQAGDDLRDAQDAFATNLAKTLNAYRRAHPSLHLPPLKAEGGCGAVSTVVNVRSQPAGAVVMFIPVFFYKLCQAEGINPDDTNRCDRWREMVDGVVADVSGDYDYVAHWADGAIRKGRLSLNAVQNGATITLVKP